MPDLDKYRRNRGMLNPDYQRFLRECEWRRQFHSAEAAEAEVRVRRAEFPHCYSGQCRHCGRWHIYADYLPPPWFKPADQK